ncbi:hypothetical protein BLNAU_762 [Blattamonas nauphoetae]|uniref:Uncharacterized protein n=1 Tax=Blattamonas nauphoetae TaxID=2049346 RepID=A0ABQ9YKE7_9EUKA|nr:hypothetical protein BLNAU_762 [Blattamonas nauphoetae]
MGKEMGKTRYRYPKVSPKDKELLRVADTYRVLPNTLHEEIYTPELWEARFGKVSQRILQKTNRNIKQFCQTPITVNTRLKQLKSELTMSRLMMMYVAIVVVIGLVFTQFLNPKAWIVVAYGLVVGFLEFVLGWSLEKWLFSAILGLRPDSEVMRERVSLLLYQHVWLHDLEARIDRILS